MATSTDKVVFILKRNLLEYSLKNLIGSLVCKIADQKCNEFNSFNISQIRFKLFEMYALIKNKNLEKFDIVIKFLIDLNTKFAHIQIPEPLYRRVFTSLKVLNIFACLRSDDIPRTRNLIKDYFPPEKILEDENLPEKEKTNKKELERKILKLKTTWHELILNKSKRELFFQTQFQTQYDDKFLRFLLFKAVEIIQVVNCYLPLTNFEKIINSNFKNPNLILFNKNELYLEMEDDVRFELFLDNLKLHHIYMNSNLLCDGQENKKKTCLINNTKYLRRIFKLLVEWDNASKKNENEFSDMYMESQGFCESNSQIKSIVNDILYLDSQFTETCKINDQTEHSDNIQNDAILMDQDERSCNSSSKQFKQPKNLSISTTKSDMTNDQNSKTSLSSYSTAMSSFNLRLTESNDNSTVDLDKIESVKLGRITGSNELLTDDEKD